MWVRLYVRCASLGQSVCVSGWGVYMWWGNACEYTQVCVCVQRLCKGLYAPVGYV